MLKPWVDSARFRFGTWRRRLRRRYLTRVRRLREPRAAGELSVSVVVPVKNAGAELADLIARMKEQAGFRTVEVVVVDSGSSDGSDEVAESQGARVVRIAPEEFSHSYARNLGAEIASGDYLLFTVQDALPSSDRWLLAMFSALQRHQAAAVSCGEAPRADSDLFYRAISWYHDRFMSADGRDTVLFHANGDSPTERRRNGQLSDTACLIRRDLFLRYRHRGNYAEDLDLGLRLTSDRYRLVYLSSPRVVHSHNRPAYYHLRRSYVEHLTLWELLPGYPLPPPGEASSMAADVTGSFAALDALVTGVLPSTATPCTTATLRSTVRYGMAATGGPARASRTEAPVDPRTRALVDRLAQQSMASRAGTESGHLAGSAVAFADILCDYLDDASQPTLDAARLEEFKAALFKGWALHCGVLLAAAYWRGPEAARAPLGGIHDELTSEV